MGNELVEAKEAAERSEFICVMQNATKEDMKKLAADYAAVINITTLIIAQKPNHEVIVDALSYNQWAKRSMQALKSAILPCKAATDLNSFAQYCSAENRKSSLQTRY